MRESDEYEVLGDYPPNIETIPGIRGIDTVVNPDLDEIEIEAKAYLKHHPALRRFLERTGRDAVAFSNGNGKALLIGVGLAALSIAGYVAYKHTHKEK